MDIIPNIEFAVWMTLPFVVSTGALYFLLFRPYMAYLDERDGAIGGARHQAEALSADTDAKLAELEAGLASAREKASAIRAQHRDAGLGFEREKVEGARAAAASEIESALTTIDAEVEVASSAMRETAQSLSADIAGRVLGRSVEA